MELIVISVQAWKITIDTICISGLFLDDLGRLLTWAE